MPSQINRVCIAGNLTRDPELRSLQTGASVCRLRIANNTRRKVAEEWVDKPNYFDVTVWGAQGENCARYLSKGKGVMIDGRLEWREYEVDGGKRQAVDIVADNVQFLTPGTGGGRRDDGWEQEYGAGEAVAAAASSVPPDDDIPF